MRAGYRLMVLFLKVARITRTFSTGACCRVDVDRGTRLNSCVVVSDYAYLTRRNQNERAEHEHSKQPSNENLVKAR
jgi:hypothetical protein